MKICSLHSYLNWDTLAYKSWPFIARTFYINTYCCFDFFFLTKFYTKFSILVRIILEMAFWHRNTILQQQKKHRANSFNIEHIFSFIIWHSVAFDYESVEILWEEKLWTARGSHIDLAFVVWSKNDKWTFNTNQVLDVIFFNSMKNFYHQFQNIDHEYYDEFS